MALICARCGTQNPDGNQFCQACGTPLGAPLPGPTASTPPPPPPGTPPPVPPGPPGSMPAPAYPYQSPYYAPATGGPQQPVHRTPWVLIISAIVGLVLVMAGCGTVFALVNASLTTSQTNNAGILPSPTPATTPTPNLGGSPTPPSTNSSTASNSGESVTLPTGWTLFNKDEQTITLTSPSGQGSVTIGSGPSSPPQTAQQNKDTLNMFFVGKYPDTKTCPGSTTNTGSIDGAAGIFWELCFTLTSGSQSFQAGAPLYAGANSNGSVYYVVHLITTQDNMVSFIKEASPVLDSIRWKLR